MFCKGNLFIGSDEDVWMEVDVCWIEAAFYRIYDNIDSIRFFSTQFITFDHEYKLKVKGRLLTCRKGYS